MQITRTNVTVAGEACDVHARLTDRITGLLGVAWCGVYVRPTPPVAGYWYCPEGPAAVALLTTLGVLP